MTDDDAQAGWRTGRGAFEAGDFERAHEALVGAVAAAEAVGTPAALEAGAAAALLLGDDLYRPSNPDAFEDAIRLGRAAGTPRGLEIAAEAYRWHGLDRQGDLDWAAAIEAFEAAIEVGLEADTSEGGRQAAEASYHLGIAHRWLGEYEAATDATERALELAAGVGDEDALERYRDSLAELVDEAGRPTVDAADGHHVDLVEDEDAAGTVTLVVDGSERTQLRLPGEAGASAVAAHWGFAAFARGGTSVYLADWTAERQEPASVDAGAAVRSVYAVEASDGWLVVTGAGATLLDPMGSAVDAVATDALVTADDWDGDTLSLVGGDRRWTVRVGAASLTLDGQATDDA